LDFNRRPGSGDRQKTEVWKLRKFGDQAMTGDRVMTGDRMAPVTLMTGVRGTGDRQKTEVLELL
jgi:hypothetical protein